MPMIDGGQHAQGGVIPRFYTMPVLNKAATEKAGHPVYDDIEWVEVKVLGSMSTVGSFRVTDRYRSKWKKQYEAFKEGVEYIEKGYLLSEWLRMPPGVAKTLQSLGIHTVEQFAQVSEQQAKMLAILPLRDEAKKIVAGKDDKQDAIMSLEAQNKALMARLEALEAKDVPTNPVKAKTVERPKRPALTEAQKKKMADGRKAAAEKRAEAAKE